MTSSTPDYPEYKFVPAVITANGQTLAAQYQMPNGAVVTDVSLPQESVNRKNKLQNLLSEYENSINIFSPELTEQINSIANSKKQFAIDNFQSLYEPAARSAREDYFSRLGTLDSTAYLDRYNELEKTKAQAYKDIANDYVANLDELKNNELARRYTYLNYLQNNLNSLESQNNGYLNTVSSLSSNYTNNYNNYLNRMYNAQAANSNNWWNSVFGTASKTATLFL